MGNRRDGMDGNSLPTEKVASGSGMPGWPGPEVPKGTIPMKSASL